ncbi:MAG TPA: hypothetical protein PKI14_18165 [Fervidobacterium sp.]|nr:hypothetical protein [Fervidobacterium sp.]
MRRLRPGELFDILEELKRQKLIESYTEQKNKWAFLAAVITNGLGEIAGMFSKRKPKQVTPDDFIGKNLKRAVDGIFKQEDEMKKLIEDAKKKGLKGPW